MHLVLFTPPVVPQPAEMMLADWWPKHSRSVTCQSELCVGHCDTAGVCQGVHHGSVGFKLRSGDQWLSGGLLASGQNTDRLGVSGPILES